MSDPFIGEIKMFASNFAPRGFAFCDGQLLPISQNTALFSLVGTIYGGDGRTIFGLPDLRGRAPMHFGQGPGLVDRRLGEKGGAERVTLSENELPAHSHVVRANSDNANTGSPAGAALAVSDSNHYAPNDSFPVDMADAAVSDAGGSAAHNNMQPFLAVNFIIALLGTYPSRI